MRDGITLPSFKEYKKYKFQDISNNATDGVYGNLNISPFAGETNSKYTAAARNRVLSFAHPVDRQIISQLDVPVVREIFNKVVQTSIDANYGLALANGIHVSPNTYPELYEIVLECAEKLEIPIPYVILSDTVHGINACTAGTDQFSFIAVSSMLPMVMCHNEIKFVIGHECGHLALGHVVYHTALDLMKDAGGLLPIVGPVISKTVEYPLNAWSRRSEISADRAGLICNGDVNAAKKALLKLEAGLMKIDNVDINYYVAEAEKVLESISIGKLAELNWQHPIIPKRIKALDYFAGSEVYAKCMGIFDMAGQKWMGSEQLAWETEKIIGIM